MAHIQSTVTGFTNIYNTMLNFLKTDATLVSQGAAWTKVGDYSGEYGVGEYLRGNGNGINNVYVLICKNEQPSVSAHNILMMTFTDYDAGLANTPHSQPGASIQYITIATNDTDPCEVFMVANGKRFTGYLHTQSYWNNFYVGMFLPYSEPTNYTFPVALIGQSKFKKAWLTADDTSTTQQGFLRSAYGYTNNDPSESSERQWTTALLYTHNGQQQKILGRYQNNWEETYAGFDPVIRHGGYTTSDNLLTKRIPSPGGSEPLIPVKITKWDEDLGIGTGQSYGELDGVRAVSGVGQQTGKIITDSNNDDWIVSQSGSNNTTLDYHAIRIA